MDDLMMLFRPSPETLLVRLAEPGDAAAISAMVIAAIRQSNASDYRPGVLDALAADFSREKTAAKMAQRKTLVAMVSGAIVGTAGFEAAKIQAVFVAPQFQRQGIGTVLMDEIEHMASCAQCSQVALWSSLTARDFYGKRGYVTLAPQVHRDIATVLMRKSLIR